MAFRDSLKRLLPRANSLAERVGVHVEPVHYYSSIPDRRWLRQNTPLWQRPFRLHGVSWDVDAQLGWLGEMTGPYGEEVRGLDSFRALTQGKFGPGYGPIESQVLHTFVRAMAPQRIIEVGSGVSTAVAVGAGELNARDGRPAPAITCIEPFARPALHALEGVTVLEIQGQAAQRRLFGELEPGDLLFIDSTHALRTGSELSFLYLDVIPSLEPGVFIHIHDIYLPYLFSPTVLDDIFDWQETALLAALLTNNEALAIRCSLSALHHERSTELSALLPDYRCAPMDRGLGRHSSLDGHFPSSTWLQTQ